MINRRCAVCYKFGDVVVVRKFKTGGWKKLSCTHEDGTVHKWKGTTLSELIGEERERRMFNAIEKTRPGIIKRLIESQHRQTD
jgi:hypothetical protein